MKPTEEKINQMESKLNGALGRLLVPSMSNPEIKEALKMLNDFAADWTDIINEYLL